MKRLLGAAAAACCGLAWALAPLANAKPIVISGQFLGESSASAALPMSETRQAPPRIKPLLHPRSVQSGGKFAFTDPVLQQTVEPHVSAAIGLDLLGIGKGFPGFTVQFAPPDTNAAVGATQVVETVNLSFAVFDKATGSIQAGPTDLATLFSGAGTNCESGFLSDPVVLFDKTNGRWVVTFLAASPGGPIGVQAPFLQCFAVSTTNDAAGSYFRYAWDLTILGGTHGALNDYGKLGIWPDAYYMSFNEFDAVTANFVGASPCAFQSSAMVAGAAATAICFLPLPTEDSLLPSDSDGSPGPAPGEREYFVGTLDGTSSLHLWRFHADFATPLKSTFIGPKVLSVAPYAEACGGGTCIPQPGVPDVLDSLADRLMFRAAYRNFPAASPPHESIVVSHSVTAGSAVGVRWYEIRKPGAAAPVIFQQGTFAPPDGNFRWMPSIAMDKVGDIAVGYSVSGTSLFPSIAFTGRTATMGRGRLQSEKFIVKGKGSQIGTDDRWGDYSSMSIDPVDDCTFWYAQEYMRQSGEFNWSTRLASFQFAGCH